MKKERSTPSVSLVLGLLALAVLLAQCGEAPLGVPTPAETLPPGKATAPPAETVAYAPTETATPSPRGTPSPLPTPFVLQVTGVNEVALATENFMVQGLYGNRAVGITIGEKNQVLLVDLTTGQVRRLDSSPDATYRVLPCISERWVVWEEDFDTPRGGYGVRLVAYDLKRDHEFQVPITRTAHVLEIALSGDIVVWSGVIDYYGSARDIFARNLATGQTWTVAAGPGSQWAPRVSGQWVVYLDKEERAYNADLRAHHLPTGEDFLIGQVPNPPDASAGTYHVIAGTRVVWIKYQPDPVSRLHVYDLETRTSRPLVLSDGTQITCFLELFGDDALLVEGTRIYSLEDGKLLGIIDTSRVRGHLSLSTLGSGVYRSGNRVVLNTVEETERGEVWRLYTLRLGQ